MVKSFSLLEHFPDRWRNLIEVQAICNSDVNPVDGEDLHTLPHLWACMESDLNNVFVTPYGDKVGADAYGCSRWESILGIVPADDMTLADRQFKINTKLFQAPPYTTKALEKMLNDLIGEGEYLITTDLHNYSFSIKISLDSRFKAEAVAELLDNIVPADMILNITIAYTTHDDMSKYTHDDLSVYTHDEIKITEM